MKNIFIKFCLIIKSSLVIAIMACSIQAFAATPVVSNTALNYSADQSVQPVATHTPLRVTTTPVEPQPVITLHNKKSKPLHHPKYKKNLHRNTQQKSR